MFDKFKIKKDYKKINELFDYFSENKFNINENIIDLDSLFSTEVFVDVFVERIIANNISIDNTIQIITSFLHYGDDELRINIVRNILEKVYNNKNFVNAYCDNFFGFPTAYELTEFSFNELMPIFINIIKSDINKLSIDILRFVMHNIDMEVMLKQQYIDQLIDIVNEKINNINNVFDTDDYTRNIYVLDYYCCIVELSRFIYNDNSIELLKNIDMNKAPHSIKLRVVDSMIAKNISISSEIIDLMFENTKNAIGTFILLEHLNAKDIIPKNIKLTQEDIALFKMEEWLKSYSGWDCEPFELKIVGHLDQDKYRYYIFSFRDLNASDQEKVMFGISQGYERDILSSFGIDENYSQFDQIEEDYIKQAEDLLKELKSLLSDN